MARENKTLTLPSEPHLKILREVVAGTTRVANMQSDSELVTILTEILTEIDNAKSYWPDTRNQETF
jgi:hypothetical protein